MLPESYWIFVIKNTDEEFTRRMERKTWPVFIYTVNRKKIQPGDRVIFYKAGERNKVFLGTAETASAIKGNAKEIDYTVDLRNISVWKKQVLMKPLVGKMSFVSNKDQWGLSMQGGVIRISKKDYDTIIAKSL